VMLLGAVPFNVAVAESVVVQHVDKGQIKGELLSVSHAAITIKTVDGNRQLETRDVIRITLRDLRETARLPRAFLLLANDDRLVVSPQSIDEEFLTAKWDQFPEWATFRVPLESVRSIAFRLPRNLKDRRKATARFLNQNPKDEDELVLTNGDRLGGTFGSFDRSRMVIETAAGETSVTRSDVRSLSFNPELFSLPKQNGLRTLVALVDGSWFTTKALQSTPNGEIDCETIFGTTLRVPITAIASMRFLGGRTVYLSDLPVADYQFQPFLSRKWRYRTDRNVTGGWLSLRSREYAKGLGVHSHCELSFALGHSFQEFQTVVGIDDQTDGRGSVRFRVKLDDEIVWSSGSLTGSDVPLRPPAINVRDKKRLTLLVEFDKHGDILDHANWCDTILIRSTKK